MKKRILSIVISICMVLMLVPITATRGSTSQTVALVVQGNDGTNDWYYSKKIDKPVLRGN